MARKKALPVTGVDFWIREWGLRRYSRRMETCVRSVLNELTPLALLALDDKRLEVIVRPVSVYSVRAYFPIYPRRLVAREYRPKPETRVLLVLSEMHFVKEPMDRPRDCPLNPADWLRDCLRDHLGHVLLYLRSPRARNECVDAWREWGANLR